MSAEATIKLSDDDLQKLYTWVDEIPLSRPKRNITRDFSDGVMMAELIKHYYPKIVDLHNYSPANSSTQKQYNWDTLDQKVFKKINFTMSKREISDVCLCVPDVIESVLFRFQQKLLQAKQRAEDRGNLSEESQRRNLSGNMSDELAQPDWSSPPGGNRGGLQQANNAPIHPSQQAQLQQQSAQTNALTQQLRDQLAERDATVQELRETVEILEVKTKKLEQLVRLKDSKIAALTEKLQQAGLL